MVVQCSCGGDVTVGIGPQVRFHNTAYSQIILRSSLLRYTIPRTLRKLHATAKLALTHSVTKDISYPMRGLLTDNGRSCTDSYLSGVFILYFPSNSFALLYYSILCTPSPLVASLLLFTSSYFPVSYLIPSYYVQLVFPSLLCVYFPFPFISLPPLSNFVKPLLCVLYCQLVYRIFIRKYV
ncbi:hypothetical protein BDQ17DRAFT_779846 [Cyathus striatus]|nr:hypothetical protein BDQ17DRAFT_779846 [Cyathus striatus]